MNLSELKNKIDFDLSRGLVDPRVLLGKYIVVDEAVRKGTQYQDPIYMPFYYYLGKYITPKTMLEVGFGLGFASGCFFQSNPNLDYFFAIQPEPQEYYTPRFGIKNIKKHYKGKLDIFAGDIISCSDIIAANSWDAVLFNQKLTYDTTRLYLELIWQYMSDDGIMVVDNLLEETTKKAFLDFVRIVQRDYLVINTRYQTAAIRK